ncbi:MAG: 1-deoxy-D-xylulose-5-phosphate reductoisomerase [Rubrobacteraceae bacterium]|nr:1-deoxy-D-xylulose-5-phosphate reductoisomerase [Rubrobacter sp.]
MNELSTTSQTTPRRVTILGSTGSIGTQALDVIRSHPDRFELVGLSASNNAEMLEKQAKEFSPEFVALENGDAKNGGSDSLRNLDAEAFVGSGSASELAKAPTDVVLNGVVGFAGLAATVSALEAGNRVALANKESIVAGGGWVMSLAKDNPIIPVDSEHSAIFQCIEGRDSSEISGILLTASGGPFFGTEKGKLADAGPEDALAHPTWSMGVKNTLDSATMMNKGLEVIEAHHLFGVPFDDIKVVVHRQSVVHGGVMFEDGATILHASTPSMKLPISYGMLYPERVDVSVGATPFDGVSWTFDEPRNDVFRCLPLAYEAGRLGGAYPVVLNAANEVAVEAFLEGGIKFLAVADLIEKTLEAAPDFGAMEDMEATTAADSWARKEAKRKVKEVQ